MFVCIYSRLFFKHTLVHCIWLFHKTHWNWKKFVFVYEPYSIRPFHWLGNCCLCLLNIWKCRFEKENILFVFGALFCISTFFTWFSLRHYHFFYASFFYNRCSAFSTKKQGKNGGFIFTPCLFFFCHSICKKFQRWTINY